MRRWLLFLILVLGACDDAGPGFRTTPKVEREVDGSRFSLRQNGNIVEAIRISPEFFPQFDQVAGRAAMAVKLETGCVPKWVDGDESLLRVGVSCNGERAPKKPRRRQSLHCDIEDLYARGDSFAGHMTCR